MNTKSKTESARVQRLRRKAAKDGLQVIKYRESSRWYWQYGPFGLKDANNYLTAWGTDLEDLEEEFGLAGSGRSV